MDKKVKVVCILTCFNRREKTIKCLESLSIYNTNIDFRFIVVDDNSTDGTPNELEKLPYDVTILHGDGICFGLEE